MFSGKNADLGKKTMTPKTLIVSLLMAISFCARATPPPGDSTEYYLARYELLKDSVNKALNYQTGEIKLDGGKVSLKIPAGFKYLNKEQSKYILTELWGNPPQTSEDCLGMIFPEKSGPFADSNYVFTVSYSDIGFVKDEDAKDINYDELLKSMQEEEKEENAERTKAGYSTVHLVKWAQKPFYDDKRKILHWAKELRFADSEGANTLNYEIRILGRKGVLSLNAISTVNELGLVNNDISKVLNIASFTEGNSYFDFDPKVDQVAAWTIGGLVAGKLLAKVGFLAVILKFLAPLWKFIALAFVGLGAWFKRRLGRKKEQQEEASYALATAEPETPIDTNRDNT